MPNALMRAHPSGIDDRVDLELLRRDIHPAEVAMPDGRVITAVRVFVTDRHLIAWRARGDGSLEQVLLERLAQPCSVQASRASIGAGRLEAHLETGGTAWINRGHGCGCGSPLKALAPPVLWTYR